MIESLKQIKLFLSDVDGVMTDARIWLTTDHKWRRQFSVYDGVGLKRLQKNGIKVGVITASFSDDVKYRCDFLGVDFFYENIKDKTEPLNEIRSKTGLSWEEIAYIGDDLPDLPLIEQVGFGVTVPHALERIKEKASYVTKNPGGHGAVREVCELILEQQIGSKG